VQPKDEEKVKEGDIFFSVAAIYSFIDLKFRIFIAFADETTHGWSRFVEEIHSNWSQSQLLHQIKRIAGRGWHKLPAYTYI
jgi:hypothetical protein